MYFWCEYFYTYLIIVLSGLLTGLVLYYKWLLTYWKRKGFKYLEPSLPFGNAYDYIIGKSSIDCYLELLYKRVKGMGLKYGGAYLFCRPVLIVTDPELLKNILQTDSQHFVNRGFYVSEKIDMLTGQLFNLEGDKWKNMRKKLSPMFTAVKLKTMFNNLLGCASELHELINNAATDNNVLDIRDIMIRHIIDVISSCFFGLESNCLKYPNSEFQKSSTRITESTPWETMKFFIQFVCPTKILAMFNFRIMKQDVEDFMKKLIKTAINYREENNVSRKDFLQFIIQLKGKSPDNLNNKEIGVVIDSKMEKNKISMEEIIAQCYLFFSAGFETTSTALTYCLFELAKNQELQDKVRNEIRTILAKYNNELTYDGIMEMNYMEKVMNETLRLYPPIAYLTRQCTKDYKIPNTTHTIEEGTMIFISTLAIQNDPEYYPEPDKFDPERFSEENKNSIPQISYLPFGEGPRMCLGLRLAVMQFKVAITTILNKHKLTVNNKTKFPFVMSKNSFTPLVIEGIWLNATEVD